MIDEALCVRGVLEDLPGMDETRVQGPHGDGRYADNLVPRVEKDKLEVLLCLLLNAFSKGLYETLRVAYAVLPHFGLQVLAPAQLEGGPDLGGLRKPYAFYPGELLDGRKADGMDVSEVGQELLGDMHGRFAGDAPADNQGEKLQGRKRFGPKCLQALPRPFGPGEIVYSKGVLHKMSLKIIQVTPAITTMFLRS